MIKEFDLTDKVGIVTGAGRGIGKGIALTLAEAGAELLLVARTENEIEQTRLELKQLGKNSIAVPANVTKSDDIDKIVATALSEWGRIDILVNSAGTGVRKPIVPLADDKPTSENQQLYFLSPTSEEEWHTTIDTNVTSIFLTTRAVGPQMIKQRKGKVINISSVTGGRGFASQVLYCTSKASINMYTRSLAVEWARYNINVNAIAPGYVSTRLTALFMEDEVMREKLRCSVPMQRFCQPREVGLLAVYLASEASDYLTGQIIYLDGGLLA